MGVVVVVDTGAKRLQLVCPSASAIRVSASQIVLRLTLPGIRSPVFVSWTLYVLACCRRKFAVNVLAPAAALTAVMTTYSGRAASSINRTSPTSMLQGTPLAEVPYVLLLGFTEFTRIMPVVVAVGPPGCGTFVLTWNETVPKPAARLRVSKSSNAR